MAKLNLSISEAETLYKKKMKCWQAICTYLDQFALTCINLMTRGSLSEKLSQ